MPHPDGLVPPHWRWTAVALCMLAAPVAAQPGAAVRDAIGSQIASQMAAGQRWSAESRMVTPTLTVEDTKRRLTGLHYLAHARQLLQRFGDGTLLVWDLARGAPVASLTLAPGDEPVRYDTDRNSLLVLGGGSLSWLAPNGSRQSWWTAGHADATAAVSAEDGSVVWVGTRSGELIALDHAATATRRLATGGAPLHSLVPCPGSAVLALDDNGEAWAADTGSARIATAVAALGGTDSQGRHHLLMRDATLRRVDGQGSAQALPPPPGDAGAVRQIAVSRDGKALVAVTRRNRLLVWHAGAWREIDRDTSEATFTAGQRFLHARADGVATLRAPDAEHFLLSLVPAAQGWAVVDHEGRYDGTVDGTRDVRWQAGADLLPLDRFFDDYFHTGLLARYIDEAPARLPAVPVQVGNRVFLPPTVAIDLPGGAMQPGQPTQAVVVSESRGGDLRDDVRMFHNGKRLPPKSRIGSQRIERDGRLLVADVFAFTVEPGANELFAEALNVHGLSGRSPVVRQVTPGYRAPGRLQILGVAIDRYRRRNLDLDFAKADVQALAQATSRNAEGTYKEVRTDVLSDDKATRLGILSLLADQQRLQPDDVLVLVMAGHGVLVEGEWFFLPHDIDPADIRRGGISARELQAALVDTPARQVLLMIDACNAGATVDSFNQYRDFQRRFAQQLGRSAGISVLAATRRDQLAVELRSLGHGLFSHVALQGLAGQADVQPKDGLITAHELAAFVGDRLEARASELAVRAPGGKPAAGLQSPAYFVIGSDFPLGTPRP